MGIGQLRMWRVATWIIAVNVAVFLLDAALFHWFGLGVVHLVARMTDGRVLEQFVPLRDITADTRVARGVSANAMGPLEAYGYFSYTTALRGLQVWRFLSFQFLHANLGHIFGNMLGIFVFGPLIEDYLGRRRFLAFYLICGAAGPVMYLLFAGSHVLLASPASPLIGASAGVFGILVAAAVIAPDEEVMLLFPPIPLKLRYLALGLLAIAGYTVFTQGHNAGGEAAHLGGAAVGYLLIRRPHVLNWAETLVPKKLFGGKGGRSGMTYHGWR